LHLITLYQYGYTALIKAAESSKVEPIKLLIQAGANLELQTKVSYFEYIG